MSSSSLASRSAWEPRGCRGTLGISPSESAFRRSSGSGSWRSADCTAAGSSARNAGLRSPATSTLYRSGSRERGGVPVPGAVVHRAAERAFAQPCGQRGEVPERVGRDVRARSFRAELFEHRLQGLDRGEPERFGAFGEHDGVEHQRFDVGGVLFGVLQRDLRPVGGPVQHELFVAERFADRLDVLHRFLARERARGRRRAAARTVRRAGPRSCACSRAGELWQFERVRAPGAALVVDDQVAAAQRGGDRLGDEARERVRRLAGPAGEREHGARARGEAALQHAPRSGRSCRAPSRRGRGGP